MTKVVELSELEIAAVSGGKKWWEYFVEEVPTDPDCSCIKG